MKDSYYFQHDYNARNDPKLQDVLIELGVEGIGIYWCIIEQLYEQGGTLPLRYCKSIAFALHVDYKTIERLVNNYGLFANDGENMWSDSVLKRLDKRKDISDKRKQAAIARWRQNLDNQRQTTIQDDNETYPSKKYDGMTARTGQYLGVDSACIAAIRREAAYDYYRMKALQLPEEEKQKYIQSFEQIMDIKNKPPITQKKKLTQEELNIFLSVISVYGRGAEAAVTRFLGISKGLKHHIVKGEYAEEYKIFKSLDPNLIEQMAIMD